MEKKATVHDVAKLAGTSATTVSRVLSNNGYPVKETLRNKVISACQGIELYAESACEES